MMIPVALLFSEIKGGVFIETGPFSGEWHKDKDIIATWSRGRDKRAIVTWHQDDPSDKREG